MNASSSLKAKKASVKGFSSSRTSAKKADNQRLMQGCSSINNSSSRANSRAPRNTECQRVFQDCIQQLQGISFQPRGYSTFDLAPYSKTCQLLRSVNSVKGTPPRLLTADNTQRIADTVVQLPSPGAIHLELHHKVLLRAMFKLWRGRSQRTPQQPITALEAAVQRAVTAPSLLTVDLGLVSSAQRAALIVSWAKKSADT